MKKLVLSVVVLGALVASTTADNDNKVTICHKGQQITVSENAVAAHLAHGDAIGSCGNDDDPTVMVCTMCK